MKDYVCNTVDKRLRYNINQWGKRGNFDILYDISENVTFVQLMYTVSNVNHSVNIVGYWIFDYNYKMALPLKL